MDEVTRAMLTRRRFLKLAGGGLAAAGLAPLLAACGGGGDEGGGGATTAAGGGGDTGAAEGGGGGGEAGTLKFWWWGSGEAIGIDAWVDETIAAFQEQTGYTIDPLLLDVGQVIPQFTDAAAAGKPPDIQFFWNGIYHMENAWLGYISPLNGLIADDILAASGATPLSTFGGQQYRVGWYYLGFGLHYSKELFDKAGLDGDNPPTTWDAFLDACDKLKSSGVTPFGGGVKDGYFGEWYMVNTLTQNLDTPADAINLFIGELNWEDPRYHEHWVKLQELKDLGFFNDDISSLDLYQGTQLVDAGTAAMTLQNTAALPASQEILGDALGFMPFPTFGTGAMAGKPITDTQGFGIPTDAPDPEGAAAFLEFIHSQERVNAMWTTSRSLPADDKFDASLVDDPFFQAIHETWWVGDWAVYIADMMPTLFWTDAMFVISQEILNGTLTGDESGAVAAEVTQKWKDQNPDMVENYQKWSEDLAV